VYFLLLILALSGLAIDSTGSIINMSNVVMAVLLCIDVLFAIAVGAAWLVYRMRHTKNYSRLSKEMDL